jgi:hypothetical protein
MRKSYAGQPHDMWADFPMIERALADLKKTGFLRAEPRYRENGSRSSNLYVTSDGCDSGGG